MHASAANSLKPHLGGLCDRGLARWNEVGRMDVPSAAWLGYYASLSDLLRGSRLGGFHVPPLAQLGGSCSSCADLLSWNELRGVYVPPVALLGRCPGLTALL